MQARRLTLLVTLVSLAAASCKLIIGYEDPVPDDAALGAGTTAGTGAATGTSTGTGGHGGGASGTPLLVLAPLDQSFGPVKPGATSSHDFTLKNAGDGPSATLGHASLSGAGAVNFAITKDGCVGVKVQPNAACTVHVSFQAPPEPFDGDLHAALMVGAVAAATATLTGTVRHWIAESPPDASAQLNAVYAQSSSSIFAVGSNGTVLFSHGDGVWEEQSTPVGNQTLNAVYGSAGGHIYAAGNGINLIHQPPASTGWSLVTPLPSTPMTTANAIWASPSGAGSNQVFVFGDGGKYLAFKEGNTPQIPQSMAAPYAAHAATGLFSAGVLTMTVVGDNDSIQYYSDAAGAFTGADTLIPATVGLRGVFSPSPSVSYAVGTAGVVLKHTGNNWTPEAGVPMVDYNAVWGSSASDIYVVGAQGTILHSTGNGNWTQESGHTSADLRGVSGAGGDVYAVGDGVILRRLK